MDTVYTAARTEAESRIEAFEAAWFREGVPNLADYLPDRSHPLYRQVLRELACVELELAWAREKGRRVEDYRLAYPELFEDRECLAALAYQEYSLRRDAGEDVVPGEYSQRFGLETDNWPKLCRGVAPHGQSGGSWREKAALLFEDFRRLSKTQVATGPFLGSVDHADLLMELRGDDTHAASFVADADSYPEPDTEFLGFRLVSELGRGAFGRVFLAEQHGLANRRVVLKVGGRLSGESQVLARLQHSNVMPIYSEHAGEALQAVCMPYFGPTTLADVFDSMRRSGGVPARGNALWNTLRKRRDGLEEVDLSDTHSAAAAPPLAAPESEGLQLTTLSVLQNLDHVRAVLWLAVRLSDGLAHAHERAILHRDLKPANVLLSDDGQPMLLDFNLSHDARHRSGVPALFGGTLPYMAPEHLEVFLGGGRPVDARSDIYALGLVLFELLTGSRAYPLYQGPLRQQIPGMIADRLAGPPPVRSANRAATPAVESILRRCLDPDPARRYQSARQLQEDAQRQFDDLPLRHAPDRSLSELGRKWLRRHPRLAWAGGVATLAVLLLVVGLMYSSQRRHVAGVEAAYTFSQFREEVTDAEILLSVPFPDATDLDEGEQLCRRALARYGLPDTPNWERTPSFTNLEPEQQRQVRADCGELLLLLVRPIALRSARESDPFRRTLGIEDALRLNALAESCSADSGSKRVVLWQRAQLVRLAGREDEAQALLSRAEAIRPREPRDYLLLGGEMAGQGEIREALRWLREADRRAPDRAGIWAARGACHAALGQPAKAAACWDTCIALRPSFWRGYLWRGQAYLDQKEYELARDDLDAVLDRRPTFAPAHYFRALAQIGLKDFRGAEESLTRAMELDPGHTRLYFTRARVRELADNRDGARRDFEEGMRRVPADELSWTARGEARMASDAEGALADFDVALELDPSSRNAAQKKAHVLAEKLGRTEEAVAVLDRLIERYPDYVPALAGRGVLLARLEKRRAALDDAEEALRQDTSARNLYQVACIYALTSRQEQGDGLEAFRLLSSALKDGFGADLLESDPDLAPLHRLPEFGRLVEIARVFRKP